MIQRNLIINEDVWLTVLSKWAKCSYFFIATYKISSGKSSTMGRSTRTVMGDLGNNAAGSNRAGLRAKDNNAPVQKPGRTLAKQKVISVPSNNWVMAITSNSNYILVFFLQGTASLKQVLQGPAKPVVSENVLPGVSTRQLRKRSREATEKPQADSMEVDPLPQVSCGFS